MNSVQPSAETSEILDWCKTVAQMVAERSAPAEEWPAVPVNKPSWAKDVEIDAGFYPEVVITYRGKSWGAEGQNVRLVRMDVIYVADHENPNGEVDRMGEHEVGPVEIVFGDSEISCSVDDASSLSIALEDAVLDYRKAI